MLPYHPSNNHMTVASTSNDPPTGEPPLWSIGLVVLIMLLAPIGLYSLAPSGPLREGDTVFSDGQQTAVLSGPAGVLSSVHDTCLLDPGHPLIVLKRPMDRADGRILAQVQGNPAIEWPFCRPHAEVLLAEHQISQQADAFKGMKTAVSRWFSR